MASIAVNGESSSAPAPPDELNRPPPGVVLPPKDIRVIVERTAGYVARNGVVFADRIRDKEKSNPKFSFLGVNDAYNPFYVWRLNEVKEGRGTDVSAGRVGQATVNAEPEKPKGPAPPPDFHFSARMPNISAQDLEVVRLTALFVAKNGRSFMTALSQRESRNYQFDFLRPQHSLHQFFSRLVDQYTDLLQAQTVDGGKVHKARLQELEANVQNRFHVLGRAKQRAEWVKFQEQQKQKKEEEEEKERLEYAQIDWHDFVVVETVLFTEADDQADLPPPTSLNHLQSASLEQKAAMSLRPHNMRIEEAMPTDEDAFYNPYAPQQYQYSMPPPAPMPYNGNGFGAPVAPPPAPDYSHPPPMFQQLNAEEARAINERSNARERAQVAQIAAKGVPGQPMRIRNDYVPRAQAKRLNQQMALCPNCSQQIPVDELTEHMRIELLDPQWKEQRQKAESRQASTHLSNIDVAANLKRLASQRGDTTDAADEEAKRRKAMAAVQPAAPTAAREGLNIDEQIQQIRQKFG